MTFLHPSIALAGALCIAIPIAIHLLMRRRRRPVPWAAMRFLIEAYRKQKRRLTLEQLILLALRCLLLALVGVALARPMLGIAGALTGPGARTVYLVVDNSLASSATGADGKSALDQHRERANRILAQLDASRGDRAGLVVLGAPAETLVAPASPDIAGVQAALELVKPTDGPADWTGAVASLREVLSARRPDEGPASLVVLSDMRAGSLDLRQQAPKLGVSGVTVLVSRPASESIDNITVTDAEPIRGVLIKSPDTAAEEPVRVTLRRSGPGISRAGATEVRVSVDTPGAAPARPGTATVRWASGQEEASVSVNAPSEAAALAGAKILTASIDRDAVAADNTWRRPVRVSEAVEVALISPPATVFAGTIDKFTPTDWYRLALNPEGDAAADRAASGVRVTQLESSQAGVRPLGGFDAVIITNPEAIDEGGWRSIAAFARAGGAVIVSPAPDNAVNVWPDAMTRALGLEWQVARESRAIDPPATITRGKQVEGRGGLLTLIGGELEDLLNPVRVRRVLDVKLNDVSARVELALADGGPFLVVGEPSGGRGVVAMLFSAPDLGWTDLPVRPLMVPLIQELVRQGAGRAGGAWQGPAGSKPPVPPGAVELRGGAGNSEVVPIVNGESSAALREAGVWRALDDRGNDAGLIAVNADPAAGRVETQTENEVAAWLNTLASDGGWRWLDDGAIAAAGDRGDKADRRLGSQLSGSAGTSPISVPLLLAGLGIALAELAMARWSSHARGMQQEAGSAA